MTCSHCQGNGIGRRWKSCWTEYACTSCGGLGDTATLIGRLDGLHEYPDVTAPTRGERLALVYIRDGAMAQLPRQVYWRLVLALSAPNFKRGKAHGGTRRDVKDSRGSAISIPVMKSSLTITGELMEPEELPEDFPLEFEGCVQEAVGFPRSSYRGAWSITPATRGKRMRLTSRGIILDKVH